MDQSQSDAPTRVRVLMIGFSAIFAFFTSVGLFLYLKPGGSAPTPEELPVFVAGPVDGFEPLTASYFELEHVFIVRLSGGSLVALYDLSPANQADLLRGDESALDCRVQFVEDEIDFANPNNAPRGFENMVFWDPCHNNWWDAAGEHLIGPSGQDLDRFPVTVVDDVVRVDVNNRRCTNEISAAAPCIPTQ